MKIGLDFDGVIADCGRLKSAAALKFCGAVIPPEDFKKELVIERGLLTLDQYRELQRLIYGTREWGLTMEPVPDVFTYLETLANRHDVSVVTSRGEQETEIAREWLEMQGKARLISFISVGYGNAKSKALRGYDVFVDDDLDKIEPLIDIVPHRFLFSWGYNRHLSEGDVAQRVESWRELYQRIQELEKEGC